MTVIKILLVLSALALLLLFLRSHGTTRGGAYAKIAITLFLLFAVYAVLRPDDVSWMASVVGVGRGTDLVLYALVVGFGFFAISTYLRFKEMELKYARLARAVALSDAARRYPIPEPSAADPTVPAETPVGASHLAPDGGPDRSGRIR